MTLNSEQEKVLNNIDEQHLIKMLSELIKIPSQNPPGEEQRIASGLLFGGPASSASKH